MRRNTRIFPLMMFSLMAMLVLSLAGCSLKTTRNEIATVKNDRYAKQLYLQRDFYAASKEYLVLAASDPKNKLNYQLSAIDALIKNQQIDQARKISYLLQQEKLNNTQNILKNIYDAHILLAEGNIDSAYAQLISASATNIPRAVVAKFYEARARVLQAKGKYFAVAKNRILLNSYLNKDQEIDENYQALWQTLSYLSLDQIEAYLINDAKELTSWLELAVIKMTALQGKDDFENAIAEWQQRYPAHPASHTVLRGIVDSFEELTMVPSQIALLLPFNSVHNDAAVAIREGFMAAWYQSGGYKPTIRIYQTSINNIVEVYQRAITEGTDFIVGPLQKMAISKLIEEIEESDVAIDTLLLNQYNGERDISSMTSGSLALPIFRQFYISPEEEARQVAERAWFDGHARAIVITTEDKTARRMEAAFSTYWSELGGTVLGYASIEQNIGDFRNFVQSVFNIKQSRQRINLLSSRLGRNLKAVGRRRDDIDLIFMVATPTIARRLVPELRYYKAEDIAFYATSSIYAGSVNRRADNDLNNVIFNDMPWVIDPEHKYSPLNRTINRGQKMTHQTHTRLHAFGIDAYHIIPNINQLMRQPTQKYKGKTGIIKFTKEGKVNRQLIWGHFSNGKPELYNTFDLN